ncbi:MAG: TolC family protein [Elusimicrobia bacterium]|nr:TolC family protein [Elusimicrobiota bacterium]
MMGLILLARGPSSAAGPPYPLEECFRLALARSEAVAMREELVDQAEARVRQSRAAFLPTLAFGYAYLKQDLPGSSLARSLFPAEQETAKASAGQSLFRGLRDLSALRRRRAERGGARWEREQAARRLFEDTAAAFYDVLAYEADLANYRAEIEAHEERRVEVSQLRRLARARDADVVAIESSIASLEAELAAGGGLLDSSRETLALLTGLPPESSLAAPEPSPDAPEPLEAWLAGAERRPDVAAARSALEAAEQEWKAAIGGHLPAADLGFNYYVERPGVSSDVRWDAQVGVSVPLFSGGLVRAQVAEAASRVREKELALGQARRQAESEIRLLYKALSAALEQAAKLGSLTELSRRGYELRLKDSRLGLATNVDVLQSLAAAHQARRRRDHARLAARQQRARLEAVSARGPLP